MTEGRHRAPIALLTLVLALLVGGAVAFAAGAPRGGPDPSFGTGGWVVPSLPAASSPSRFETIVPVAGGRFLDLYAIDPGRSHYFTAIERREADGELDPSFGDGGTVKVEGSISALAEDPSGGVVYGGSGAFGRLQPDGAADEAFEANARYASATGIAFDAQGRMLVVRSNLLGPRYHPHAGELELLRYEPDGRSDLTFGEKGVVYLGPGGEGRGEIAVLPDGSILVDGLGLKHLAADGTALPNPEAPLGEGSRSTMAVFPDGSFAVSASAYEEAGCTVTRYGPAGTRAQGFAQKGAFTDPDLYACALTAGPEGSLLVRGAVEVGGQKVPRLLLLDAAGAPVAGFGNAVSALAGTPANVPLQIEDVAVASGGRILVAAGGEDAVLLGLGSNGAVDPAFGSAGSLVVPTLLAPLTAPSAIAAEPDGELIVTGVTDSGSSERRSFWMRFSAAGEPIPTSTGAPFASVPNAPFELQPAGPGNLYGIEGKGERLYVAKLRVTGAPVEGFGKHGLVAMPKKFEAASLVVDPDGGVTVVGTLKGHGWRMAAYRLTAAGRPLAGFGHRGMATVRFPRSVESQADSAALRPGGDLVITGLADERLAVAELGPNGRPRRNFGHGGVFTCSCGGTRPARTDVVGHRGRLYVLDHWKGPGAEGNSLVKLSGAGRLARSFAHRGYRPVQVGAAIALFARGGRLIVAGQKAEAAGPAQLREFTLAGKVAGSFAAGDPTFAAGGKYETARFPVTMQPDGRIVFAGSLAAKQEIEGAPLALLGLSGGG